jgi:TDG/mug DNA glycosylase family protein
VEDLAMAEQKGLPDVIGPRLSVLFCGINPGLYSAATGHHFARPGNRFWPTLFAAGFTRTLLSAHQDTTLLELGLGITNLVARTTASADLLTSAELVAGTKVIERKLRKYQPRLLAIVGLGAYRSAFREPKATCGLQPRKLAGSQIWLLPNPSGLNAHHQVADLAVLFSELRRYVQATASGEGQGP